MSLPRTVSSLRTRRMLTWFVPVVGLTLYLILVPPVPDFSAQATRAAIFAKLGSVSWWPGWYGGIELPTYSVIAPAIMAKVDAVLPGGTTVGVAVTGALASAICMWVGHLLLRDSARPRAASMVFAATILVNLFGGRITFLVGLAAAMLAMLALVRRHPWLAAAAAVVSVLGSPLAGLFVGIAAAAVLVTDRSRRREALFAGVASAGAIGVLALLFDNPGVMPSSPGLMLLALLALALVAVACRQPTIRAGVAIVAVGLVLCLLVPNSVGQNLTRMVWLLAAPLIVGYGHRPDKYVVAFAGLALIFPVADLSWQLAQADSPAAKGAYYQPLLRQLDERMYSGATVGQRVELVEPQTKGGAWHVGESIPLARGWERQIDRVDNPIFYENGALTATSYRQWLNQLAVGYVAVPNATLDFASVDEGALIKNGLPYLAEVWHNQDWKLYRVLESAPLARNAQVVSVNGNQVRLQVAHPGPVPIQIRWSNHLVVLDGTQPVSSGVRAHGCLSQNGQWTLLHARAAGSYVLTSDVDLLPDGAQRGGVCRSPDS